MAIEATKFAITDLPGGNSSGAGDWSAAPASFLESSGVRMMKTTLVIIISVTALLLILWFWTYPTASQLALELKSFPSTAPSALTSEQVIDLLGKRQATYTENFRSMFQLLVLSGLVPIFTLLSGYIFGKSK